MMQSFSKSKMEFYKEKYPMLKEVRIVVTRLSNELFQSIHQRQFGSADPTEPKSPLEEANGPSQFNCFKCGKVFMKEISLRAHERRHAKLPSKCEICQRTVHRRVMTRHMKTHTDQRHQCTFCESSFTRKDNLNYHIRCHHSDTNEKKLGEAAGLIVSEPVEPCEIAQKTVRKGQMSRRKKTHTYQRIQCPLCESSFTRKDNLYYHVRCQHSGMNEKNLAETTSQLIVNHQIEPPKVKIPSSSTSTSRFPRIAKFNVASLCERWDEDLMTIENQFDCTKCTKSYPKRYLLNRHMKMSHKRKMQCQICEKILSNSNEFLQHLRTHHLGEKPFSCSICNMKFSREETLKSHLAILHKHANGKSTLKKTSSIGDSKRIVKRSNRDFSQRNVKKGVKSAFVCPVCEELFTVKSVYRKHMGVHRRMERNFSCQTCGKTIVRLDGFVRHLRTHSGVKPYKCEVCDYASVQLYNLNVHIQKCHPGHTHLIKHKIFKMSEFIENERKYDCKKCPKSYQKIAQLKRHIRLVHKLQCQTCLKSFANSRNYLLHLKIHNEKPHGCSICQMKFSNEQTLQNHMRIMHNGKFVKSNNIENLKTGNKRSTNQRLANKKIISEKECPICPETFPDGELCKEHTRTHSKMSNFKCKKCNIVIENYFNFIRHMKIHSGLKPNKCQWCGKRFLELSNMNIHIRTIHPEHKNKIKYKYKANKLKFSYLNENPKKSRTSARIKENENAKVEKIGQELFFNSNNHGEESPQIPEHLSCGEFDEDDMSLKIIDCYSLQNTREDMENSDQPEDPLKVTDSDPLETENSNNVYCKKEKDEIELTDIEMNKSERPETNVNCDSKTCGICGKVQTSAFHLEEHMRSHTGETPFECRFCGRAFSRISCHTQHLKAHRSQMAKTKIAREIRNPEMKTLRNRLVCELCDRVFSTQSVLDLHMKTHHKVKCQVQNLKKVEKTEEIETTSLRRKTLLNTSKDLKDQIEVKKNGENVCQVCQKSFERKRDLERHLTIHAKPELKCKICEKVYLRPDLYKNHIAKAHKMVKTRKIGFSPREKPTKQILTKINEPIKTEPKNSRIEGNVKVGIKTKGKSICQICHETFRNKQLLQSHVTRHKKENGKYLCKLCSNRQFERYHDFARHLIRHRNDKSIKCQFCVETFYENYFLNNHIKKFHSNALQGQESQEENQVHSSLSSDFSQELEEREFYEQKASEFIEIFPDESQALVSANSHIQENDEEIENKSICRVCHEKFENKQLLMKHVVRHKRENGKYTCKLCSNREFELYIEFAHHLMTHRKEKSVKCQFCLETFYENYFLNNHIKKFHSNALEGEESQEVRSPSASGFSQELDEPKTSEFIEILPDESLALEFEAECDFSIGNESRGDFMNVKTPCNGSNEEFEQEDPISTTGMSSEHKNLLFGVEIHEVQESVTEFINYPFESTLQINEISISRNVGISASCPQPKSSLECDICGRKFTRQQDQAKHAKSHMKKPWLNCVICQMTFERSIQLAKHMLIHNGKFPNNQVQNNKLSCNLCGEKFGNEYYLNLHMMIHAGKRPFKCHLCNGHYSTNGSLQRHLKQSHNIRSTAPTKPNSTMCEEMCSTNEESFDQMNGNSETEHSSRGNHIETNEDLGSIWDDKEIVRNCDRCNGEFYDQTSYNEHLNTCEPFDHEWLETVFS